MNQIEKKSTPWSSIPGCRPQEELKLGWWARRINIYSPWHPDAIYSQILHQHQFWVVYPSHFSWRWSAENLERTQFTTNQDSLTGTKNCTTNFFQFRSSSQIIRYHDLRNW
jgi:hypothetical protein